VTIFNNFIYNIYLDTKNPSADKIKNLTLVHSTSRNCTRPPELFTRPQKSSNTGTRRTSTLDLWSWSAVTSILCTSIVVSWTSSLRQPRQSGTSLIRLYTVL